MDGRIVADVAEGPIVGVYVYCHNLLKDIHPICRVFTEPRELLTCTLLGKVTQYQICGSAAGGTLKLEPRWIGESKDSYKVNSIAFSGGSIIIGGFQKDGTGVIEVWSTC